MEDGDREFWALVGGCGDVGGGGVSMREEVEELVRRAAERLMKRVHAYDDERTLAQDPGLRAAVEGLRQIAEHPHSQYDHPEVRGSQYGVGVVDGHRCAAKIARSALRALVEGKSDE